MGVTLLFISGQIMAQSPACTGPGENKVSWPTNNPVWEMCYLKPSDSSAAQGSSLEIRDVHYNGHLVMEKSHIPMLFAKYNSSTCYRDWKNTNSDFLKADQEENPTRPAFTTCDVSTSQTLPVYNCPFKDVNDPNYPNGANIGSAADCFQGVQVEKYSDHMVLTTNHSAAWYKYSSRYTFYLDGRIQPRFGFGNSDGTNDGITHWHHAYWRVNFDIDGPENDEVYINDTVQNTEFFDFRVQRPTQTWSVIDSVSGRGYRIEPTAEDYLVGTDPSGAGFHNVDVMVTKYKIVPGLGIPEYSDTPGFNNIGNCGMDESALVNGEALAGEDVVFWYRTAVNDIANLSLNCKSGGPVYYPIGDWARDLIFENGFETP